MNEPKRLEWMFTPDRWALPLSIGVSQHFAGNTRRTEIGICVGPFGLSILVGSGTPMAAQRQPQDSI